MELKNYLECQFASPESAFSYFLTYGDSPVITFLSFSQGCRCLMPSRKYTEVQLKSLYHRFLRDPSDFATGFGFN